MLAERIERKIFKDIAPKGIHYIKPVHYRDAQGLVATVYDQLLREFQLVPPITIHAAVPELLAGVWSMTRESMVAGDVSRAEREAIPAAVSHINQCPFCVDVHSTMLHGGSEHGVAAAILSGNVDQLPDSRIGNIARWALATRSPGAEILRTPPFSPEEAPELIGTAVAFHYINRMVNVFLDESPFALLPIGLRWTKGFIPRVAGKVIAKRILGVSVTPGESLDLLPDAELPPEFSWAESNPAVAGAFARLSAVIEQAGADVLSDEVRDLVRQHVESWNGDDPGMSRRWVEDAVAGLREPDQAAARLTLLTALASYQVDEKVIHEFRQHYPSDAQLIAATAWASFTAARKVSSWLHPVLEREEQLATA
ncbi:MAG: carboxymuconolactone decarboxylase family protein [Planctomycetes bacterium]|nr:carboxymuconolactone decarboxylase family protein [Planctomycetota bacterium]